LFFAYAYANSVKMLTQSFGLIEVAGSVRRGKEVVDNVDLVFSFDENILINKITSSFDIKGVIKKQNSIIFKDVNNFELKFFKVQERYFYSGLQYYTGSKYHNHFIQEIALLKGSMSQKRVSCCLKQILKKNSMINFSLAYIPPEIREGEEEIALALNKSLPDIVDLDDIKGDLHVHSNFSDGSSSISEIKEEGQFLCHEYIAITDHSKLLRLQMGFQMHLCERNLKL